MKNNFLSATSAGTGSSLAVTAIIATDASSLSNSAVMDDTALSVPVTDTAFSNKAWL